MLVLILLSAVILSLLSGCAGPSYLEVNHEIDQDFNRIVTIEKRRYSGRQPHVWVPDEVGPLPFQFCEAANKWIFTYFYRNDVQFYAMNPTTSYRKYMEKVIGKSVFPWAIGTPISDESRRYKFLYFVNTQATENSIFDYTVSSSEFDACNELAQLPFIILRERD